MIGLAIIALSLAFAWRAHLAVAYRVIADRAFGVRNNVRFDPSGSIAEVSFWFDGVPTRLSIPYGIEHMFTAGSGPAHALMHDGSKVPLHLGGGFFCRYTPADFGAGRIQLTDPDREVGQDECL